jgi:2-oxo-4-hydroxy-4-carboxy--5-ureidoimidazoline (OHCU) decarboxylase
MSNELDTLSAGELQPYNEGQPLAPMSHDDWANTGVDLLREDHHQPQGPTLFGATLPPGTTAGQVEQMLIQLGAVFANDMGSLGYPAAYINATVQFYQSHAAKKSFQVTKNHNFNLHGHEDYLGTAFANMVQQTLSGSPRAKQQWITSALTWLAKATARLNPAEGQETLPTAPSSSSEAMLSRLSDADYNRVITINEQAQANSLATLAAKHGQYTAQNMVALAQAHLEKLTPRERQHFDQFTTANGVNWIHILNCAETIEFLYNASIGSGTLPVSGAAISAELKEIEALLATPIGRRKYFEDPTLQARYRTLLDMRD